LDWIGLDELNERVNRAIMDPEFTVVGIGHGPHTVHKCMTVVTFAMSFIEGVAVRHLPRDSAAEYECHSMARDRVCICI